MNLTFQHVLNHSNFTFDNVSEVIYHGPYGDTHAFHPEWKDLPIVREAINDRHEMITLVLTNQESDEPQFKHISGKEWIMMP